jgi:hypothetical protein
LHTIFVEANRTADFRTTKNILQILADDGNREDLVAFMYDIHLPVDEGEKYKIADEILVNPPAQGYLASSPVHLWKQYYIKAIELAGKIDGIRRVSSRKTAD